MLYTVEENVNRTIRIDIFILHDLWKWQIINAAGDVILSASKLMPISDMVVGEIMMFW